MSIRTIWLCAALVATASGHAQEIGPESYKARREALMQMLDGGIAVMYGGTGHSSSSGTGLFYQEASFHYLTGIDDPGAALILAPAERRYREILFLKPRNPEVEDWDGRRPSLGEALEAETGFDEIRRTDRLGRDLTDILQRHRKLVFLGPVVSATAPIPEALKLMRDAQARVPGSSLVNMADLIPEMRRIKSDEEIGMIRRAVDVTGAGILAAMQAVRPGMREFQLQSLIDNTYRQEGAQFLGFTTIMAWGPNTTVLHYQKNDQPIGDQGLVLLDTGAAWDHYSADVTRTFPVTGTFTSREREIYNIVLEAQEAAISNARAGADHHRDIHLVAKQVIDDAGYGEYFIHGAGHFLGLHVHDAGDYERPLEPGVVITVEPGIYIPEEGIGVRIEDVVLITDDDPEILSGHIPRTIAEVENAMRR